MRLGQLLLNQHFATTTCSTGHHILLFPTWYAYLSCTSGNPQLTNISDIWLIVAAAIEILLRLAAIVATVMIIYAGIQYATSQGEPEKTRSSLRTIISAATGLLICILAAVIVNFIARQF